VVAARKQQTRREMEDVAQTAGARRAAIMAKFGGGVKRRPSNPTAAAPAKVADEEEYF